MKDLEAAVEQYLRRRVEAKGGRCVKFDPGNYRGWPDRIVLLPHGITVWVETKRPTSGRVAPAQRLVHEELRRLGQRVEIVWSKDDVDGLLEKL